MNTILPELHIVGLLYIRLVMHGNSNIKKKGQYMWQQVLPQVLQLLFTYFTSFVIPESP